MSFFGVGVQHPTASWGNMLYQAQTSMTSEPWLAIIPGLFILATGHACIAIGANAHVGIVESIRTRRPDLTLRGKLFTDITADDLAWAEAYIGFKRPPSVSDMGNVRWIQCTGAGVDSWMASDLDLSILLTRSPESFGPVIDGQGINRTISLANWVPEAALPKATFTLTVPKRVKVSTKLPRQLR